MTRRPALPRRAVLPRRTAGAAALVAALLALSACGGSETSADGAAATDTTVAAAAATDTTATADETTDEGADTTMAADESSDDEGGDGMAVSSLDDIPQECRDAMADFLKVLEPSVSTVDWDTATLADMEALGTLLETEGSELDTTLADASCDNIDPGSDEESLALMIELAEQEAPGTIGWLQFIGSFAADVDESGMPVGDGTVPTDCDGAIAYVEGLTTEADTMMDLPMTDITNIGIAMEVISTDCSLDQSNAFFEDYAAFFGG